MTSSADGVLFCVTFDQSGKNSTQPQLVLDQLYLLGSNHHHCRTILGHLSADFHGGVDYEFLSSHSPGDEIVRRRIQHGEGQFWRLRVPSSASALDLTRLRYLPL